MIEDAADTGARRATALEAYRILGTPREAVFDEIAQFAADLCDAPIAVVNLVSDDRQFFKAEVGLGVRETPLETSFCVKALLEKDFLLVPDATRDNRFDCNPLVTGEPHLRFYAGALLETTEGVPIGTLCILDYKPRTLTAFQQNGLCILARQVMAQLDLRRALFEALEGESYQQAVFDSAQDYAIIATDLKGLVVKWSIGARQILGWSGDEMVSQPLDRIFTPEDRTSGVPELELTTARDEGRAFDLRWTLRKDGERFWANGEVMPLRTGTGTHIGYVTILRDRTAERLAEQRLAVSEARWRELFENMREGYFTAELQRDEDGKAYDYRFLEINKAFADQSGLPGSSVGQTIRELIGSVDQSLIDRFAETVETGEPQVFDTYVPAIHRWFEVRSAKDYADRFSCLFLDVTARKAIEHELALNDERLKMALAASGAVGLWDWIVETDLLHGDANFARLYGLEPVRTAAGLTMEQYQEFVVPDDVGPLRERIRAVFERGEDFLIEYRVAVPGQPLRWIECRGKIVPDGDGAPFRFSGTAIDITDRKKAEEQKQLLMAEMSHRVKNTFAMVQSIVAQTLRGADPQITETLQSRLAALSSAHDILLRSSWSSMAISDLVWKVLRLSAEGERFEIHGLEIDVNSEAALSLSLLLHELATNASKYGALSTEGGTVIVSWSVDDGAFRLRWTEAGGPAIAQPIRRGFGSRLIGMGICGSREVHLRYAEQGLIADFSAEIGRVVA